LKSGAGTADFLKAQLRQLFVGTAAQFESALAEAFYALLRMFLNKPGIGA